MAQIRWRGVFPALTTRFTAADKIDWNAMARHQAFQPEAGVHGLIMLTLPADGFMLLSPMHYAGNRLETVAHLAGGR